MKFSLSSSSLSSPHPFSMAVAPSELISVAAIIRRRLYHQKTNGVSFYILLFSFSLFSFPLRPALIDTNLSIYYFLKSKQFQNYRNSRSIKSRTHNRTHTPIYSLINSFPFFLLFLPLLLNTTLISHI